MTATAHHTSTVVVDNAAYAWRNIPEHAQAAFYGQLDPDFVHDYRAQLDTAATVLFGPLLIQVWAEHGYQVTFGPDGLPMQRRPKGFPHHQVWDTAAARLDPYAVVIKASELSGLNLDDELLRYAAAHPRVEHLDRAVQGLRPYTEQLRTELLDRLDQHAPNATSPRAEAQWDGWRHAVETAWSYAQLAALDSEIPS